MEQKKALYIQAHITATNVSVLVNIMSDWFWWWHVKTVFVIFFSSNCNGVTVFFVAQY